MKVEACPTAALGEAEPPVEVEEEHYQDGHQAQHKAEVQCQTIVDLVDHYIPEIHSSMLIDLH